MKRTMGAMVACGLFGMAALSGCAESKGPAMGEMKLPPRAAALDRLEPMMGEWEYTLDMTMPGAEKPMTSKGTSKVWWACDRQVMLEEVEGDMGPGAGRFHGLGVTVWDAEEKVYRSMWYDNTGAIEHGMMTYDEATKTFHGKGKGENSITGEHSRGDSWAKLVDANTIEWGGTQTDSWGMKKKMEMKGTNKRRKM